MFPAEFYVPNRMKKKISGLLVKFFARFLMLTLFLFLFSLTVHKPLLYIAAFNFSSLYLFICSKISLYIATFNLSLAVLPMNI